MLVAERGWTYPGAMDESDVIDPEVPAQTESVTSSSPVSLTLTQAAEACLSSKSTIRRRLNEGAFPNSFREPEDGPWLIPVPDLIAAGFRVNSPVPVIDLTDDTPRVDGSSTHKLELELAKARGDVDRWRAVADERDRTITGFERVMRLLPSAPLEAPAAGELATSVEKLPSETSPSVSAPVTDPPPRRGLFGRRKPNPQTA